MVGHFGNPHTISGGDRGGKDNLVYKLYASLNFDGGESGTFSSMHADLARKPYNRWMVVPHVYHVKHSSLRTSIHNPALYQWKSRTLHIGRTRYIHTYHTLMHIYIHTNA